MIEGRERNKVGIFGGTFDPVHFGHLHIAKTVKDKLGLDSVYLIPNNKNPFKQKQHKEQRRHCYNMVKKAIENDPDLKVSDIEINREGPSYTIDTIKELNKKYDADFYFIIGTDILESIEDWKSIGELFKLVRFVVVDRPSKTIDNPKEVIDKLNQKFDTDIIYLPIDELDVSSTMVRKRIRENKPVTDLLPEKVIQYIRDKGLYAN